MAVGGDIIEITYNHPVIGSGVFYAKSAEDSTVNIGGFRTADDNNGIAGNGEIIKSLNQSRWSIDTVTSWDMNTRKDMENMVGIASSAQDATFTFSWINGINYTGTGTIVGDLGGNGNKATIPAKFSGGCVGGVGLKQI